MGMTVTEKIIAAHAREASVSAGEIVEVDVDWCMVNDATVAHTIDIFEKEFEFNKVFNAGGVIFVNDHQVPADSVATAEYQKKAREFAAKHGLFIHESDGVCHQIMVERYVRPAQLIAAADSHTLSYGCIGAVSVGMGSTDIAAIMGTGKTWLKVPESIKVSLHGSLREGVYAKDIALNLVGMLSASGANYQTVEFVGSGVEQLSISERFTICNMMVEAGAKSTMIVPDSEVMSQFSLGSTNLTLLKSDNDAHYVCDYDVELGELVPMLACPHAVDNVVEVIAVEDRSINQAFLGSCTNGRIEDLRVAATILKNQRVHSGVRFLVTPASVAVYRQALAEGVLDSLIAAGAIINHPGCSTCWGACQGVLAASEIMISTANRNFCGRAGSSASQVYLASPATVAVSALKGVISDPREIIGG